jgi:hypothetical protein
MRNPPIKAWVKKNIKMTNATIVVINEAKDVTNGIGQPPRRLLKEGMSRGFGRFSKCVVKEPVY